MTKATSRPDREVRSGRYHASGSQLCHLVEDSKVRQMYGSPTIYERHRHRYEVNNKLLPQIEAAGLKVTGLSADKNWWKSSRSRITPGSWPLQFHPEFTSTPRDGHPCSPVL